jgi:tellurite resistance protein TerC
MIAGASWTWWVGFHAVVLLLLSLDLFILDAIFPGLRTNSVSRQRLAWIWTFFLTLSSALFALWLSFAFSHQTALEFIAGYTIESSLSIDNLFVFLVLFAGFEISVSRQRKTLNWGIFGAVILRAIFIFAGVALLERFSWISYIFGALIFYGAFRLLRGGAAHAVIPEWIRKLQPAKESLIPVIIAIEITDIIFALDSVPAVLAVTHNPFVVYTSNIAAILGLRSLYFAISGWLNRLRYLHYGLAALLGFVAFKMLAAHWVTIPTEISLIVIASILLVCVIFSWLYSRKNQSK